MRQPLRNDLLTTLIQRYERCLLVQHLSKPPLALTVTAAFLAASVDGLFHVSLDRRHIRLARLRGAVELRRRTVPRPSRRRKATPR
jgi:hypothetical protein